MAESLPETMRKAWQLHKEDARQAFALFDSYCADGMRRRVPGMGTTERLAVRIYSGRSVEEAAAREYLYRWNLAIKPFDQCEGMTRNPACSIFGAPHTLGM